MTFYILNRRIEVTSTYHVRRKAGMMPRTAANVLILWACFGGFVTIASALARVAGSL
jgi:hypothetical protein